jgi:hypothetical protein
MVVNVLSHASLNIGFRICLVGNKWNDWLNLCQRLLGAQLSDNPDNFGSLLPPAYLLLNLCIWIL